MGKLLELSAVVDVTIVAASAGVTPAQAISCKDGYQLVQGNYLSTPYCRDALVAVVAREYGMHVSASEIRENPNYKRRVCRFVGNDIRVQESCIIVNPSRRGRAF